MESSVSSLLSRLGSACFRHRYIVLLAWVLALVGCTVAGNMLSRPMVSNPTVPGTEAQRAIDLLNERMPGVVPSGVSAQVVIEAPEGSTLDDPAYRKAATRLMRTLEGSPQVQGVGDPLEEGSVSQDRTVAHAEIQYAVDKLSTAAYDALFGARAEAQEAGLTVEIGGVPERQTEPPAEVIGTAVAAVVLVITFGSLIAAGMPLLAALFGIGIGVALIRVASSFADLEDNVTILAVMLGLAVAIDYSLFIVSRYRHELERSGPEQAAATALATAGSAVVFAGLTVVIALAAMPIVGMPTLTAMGLAAAATVLIAILVALTLTPALLGFAKRRVLGGWIPGLRRRDTEASRSRWARLITRRPAIMIVAVTAILLVLAVPALDLKLELPDDGHSAPQLSTRRAYDKLSEAFGPGFNGPFMVVVDTDQDVVPGVDAATKITQGLDGVAQVSPPFTNEAGTTAVFQVVPTSGPADQATKDLVADLRDTAAAAAEEAGAELYVTGQTAVNIDMTAKLNGALVPYLAIVVGLAFVLLVIVLHSLIIPLAATIGFLLSIAATFGVLVAVFQWGWFANLVGMKGQTGPVIALIPVFLVGIVFGIAMDYQVFLVSRMREEHDHGAAPIDAIVTGYAHAARVVTAAAIIMISVFGGFVLGADALVKEIGFGLGFAVVVDAFLVRMTMIPAVLALSGAKAWWLPRWLDRVLPSLTLEGPAGFAPDAAMADHARLAGGPESRRETT
jgi:RND superfamily putative drug exporter